MKFWREVILVLRQLAFLLFLLDRSGSLKPDLRLYDKSTFFKQTLLTNILLAMDSTSGLSID